MNKPLYRVIFNRCRGCMMVVAETTKREGKSCADTDSGSVHVQSNPTRSKAFCFSALGFSLCLALGTAGIVQAQGIVADKNAPKTQQATILQTANGTPQINIQTPTSAGVSVNQYQQFDVDGKGAILNNSRAHTQTQLGGWIQGNPWLAGGEARVIVNQINSSTPSQLNGYIEVGGRRAEIVIANPAGIAVNGGGFINASRATLTTGIPQYQAGALTGFQVRSGNVGVNGQGLDTRDTDYTRILSQTAQIDAPVWGQDIRIVTGQNDVAATGDVHTPISNSASANTSNTGANTPLFAIDTGALGGMYANKITLISTAEQAGIRNQGQLFASAGNVAIDANGQLINSGTLASQGTLSVGAADVDNSGTMSAKDVFDVRTAGLNNSGTILAADQWQAQLSGSLNNEATGQIQAGRLDIRAQSVRNAGEITQTGQQGLAIEAAGALHNQGTIGLPQQSPSGQQPNQGQQGSGQTASGSHTASGNGGGTSVPSSATGSGSSSIGGTATAATWIEGRIQTARDVHNTGRIQANGGVDVSTQTGLNNSGTLQLNHLSVTGPHLDNRHGQLTAQTADIQTDIVSNQNGLLSGAQNLSVQAARVDNRQGHIQSLGQADLSVQQQFDNQQGEVAVKHTLALHDGRRQTLVLDNREGKIVSGANSVIDAAAVNNQNATVSAQGQVRIEANTWDNRQGRLLSGGDTILNTQSLNNRQGTIAAQHNLTANGSSFDNQQGHTQAGEQLALTVSGSLNNQNGAILSGGNAQFSAQSVSNQNGVVSSKAGLTAVSQDWQNRQGTLQSGGETSLSVATHLDNQAGNIIGGGDVGLQAQSADNRQGTIASNQNLNLRTQRLDNWQGTVQAVAQAHLQISGSLNNQQGEIAANQQLHIAPNRPSTALHINNQDGNLYAENVHVTAHTLDNRQGHISADKQLAVQTVAFNNQNGKLQSAGSAQLQIADSLDNWQGEISAHDVRIHDRQQNTLGINNQDGSILAAQDAQLQAKALDNQGQLAAGRDLDIQLHDSFNIVRDVNAGRRLNIQTQGDINNTRHITANHQVSLRAQNIHNRGTLNSNGLTLVQANDTLLNVGTGKIYGNHVALSANKLINREETDGTQSKAAVVAARERLDIGAADIVNQEAALLSSEGDLAIGGRLNDQHQAEGKAGSLINSSARIEAQGNGRIAAEQLQNLNAHFKVEEYLDGQSGQIREYTVLGQNTYYQEGKDGHFDNSAGQKNQTTARFHFPDGTNIAANQWHVRDYHIDTYKERVTESRPGQIIIGGNLTVSGRTWLNKDSEILVGKTLDTDGLSDQDIINEATQGKGRAETIGTQWDSVTKRRWYSGRKRPRRTEVNKRDYNATELFSHEFASPVSVVRQQVATAPNQQTADDLNTPNPVQAPNVSGTATQAKDTSAHSPGGIQTTAPAIKH